jgi:hypothetical protein
LQNAGIVDRVRCDRRIEYRLTEAGEALVPVLEALAVWGKSWLPADAQCRARRSGPDPVGHASAHEHRPDARGRTVIRFDFTDQIPAEAPAAG